MSRNANYIKTVDQLLLLQDDWDLNISSLMQILSCWFNHMVPSLSINCPPFVLPSSLPTCPLFPLGPFCYLFFFPLLLLPSRVHYFSFLGRVARRPPVSTADGGVLSRLLTPTQASLARSKSAAALSAEGKDAPGNLSVGEPDRRDGRM